jgi:hypothetical protein
MIGIVIRELTYLKLLQPIILELIKMKVPYFLYLSDAPVAGKEYNKPKIERVNLSCSDIIKRASRVKIFKNDEMLLKHLAIDQISKLVSIEIFLWARKYLTKFERAKIKTYNILYMHDSIWSTSTKSITSMHRIYYTTTHLRDLYFEFLGLKQASGRDRCLGSPIFDCLGEETGQDVLVLLPNLKADNVKSAFKTEENFKAIIEKLAKNNRLIFKTRKKQWFPNSIRNFASEVVMDDDVMYPSKISDIFKKTHTTVLFFSSGIYEAVRAGQYVINIPFPLARWNFNSNKLNRLFSTDHNSTYNFEGVVENVPQEEVLKDSWILKNKLNPESRKIWLEKYVGVSDNSAEKITLDLLK